jgi:hypothetical protein
MIIAYIKNKNTKFKEEYKNMLKRIDFISITLLVIIFCLASQSRAQVKEKKGETNSTN